LNPPTITKDAIGVVKRHYREADSPWILGFSGGKDSSALLQVLYSAMSSLKRHDTPVTILYCDTGVEIPVVAQYVRSTLRRLKREAEESRIPLSVRVARPKPNETYFVKVIGRGYPPPTNKFRWCTDRLRIAPVQREVARLSESGALILLGVRKGESPERDRTLATSKTGNPYMLTQRGAPESQIFAPLLNHSTEDVWETLLSMPYPSALDTRTLASLYRMAAGECPLIRDPNGTPCGKGRFGCWTCTVVRRDQGVAGLIESGHSELEPLLAFRDWLQQMRDDPVNRCRRRRNGADGLGPLTLEARRLILRRLRQAERKSGLHLISKRELALIRELWKQDATSDSYRRVEAA
jgi:DNA sulfur modification protein DndC